MMKIAVASVGKDVAEHFGHCEAFALFDVDNGQIIKEEIIPNPGHKPGFLPNFLHEKGVTAIISGGMGGGAIDIFNEKKIMVVTGASGEAAQAARSFSLGKLVSTGSVCNQHAHQGECGEQ